MALTKKFSKLQMISCVLPSIVNYLQSDYYLKLTRIEVVSSEDVSKSIKPILLLSYVSYDIERFFKNFSDFFILFNFLSQFCQVLAYPQ